MHAVLFYGERRSFEEIPEILLLIFNMRVLNSRICRELWVIFLTNLGSRRYKLMAR
jgi:hypothetical protein